MLSFEKQKFISPHNNTHLMLYKKFKKFENVRFRITELLKKKWCEHA